MNCIFNNANYLWVVVSREGFMPRLEIEYLAVAAPVAAACAQYLAALKTAYKYKLIGFGNTERLGIGFFVFKLYISVYAVCCRVRGVYSPKAPRFARAALPRRARRRASYAPTK